MGIMWESRRCFNPTPLTFGEMVSNEQHRGVDWQFTIDKTRLNYYRLKPVGYENQSRAPD
jgi:hypothetical protein